MTSQKGSPKELVSERQTANLSSQTISYKLATIFTRLQATNTVTMADSVIRQESL